ncbi:TonB-dependent receptor [Chryseobacterium oranimense]|uniref:TonB-dependent receptor domain-containing protein n=1 Tax=Chryseobacterium oranimense TaxID=421058 RepID=UPI0021B08604|nr:TonB-dependent receptor [Chryseobacterium oranimense]UWX61962.1 TonB-dependent receptor [Chryseobacterium oranimense]
MTNSKLLLTALAFGMLSNTVAAQQYTLSGSVINGLNGDLRDTNLQVKNKQSQIVVNAQTDPSGKFKILLNKGAYTLLITQLGKKYYEKSIELNGDIDLGTITISNNILLEGVVINGQKQLIERKTDRLIFNVEKSAFAAGGNGLDAITVTPGLLVSNETITMLGKSGMGFMVDGRIMNISGDALISYLKSIPSSDIKSIEVITNPPSKYSAEGNSGLVNIVLKKSRADNWSSTVMTSYQQGKYAQQSSSANLSYKKKKLSLFSNLNYSYGKYYGMEELEIQYPETYWHSDKEYQYKINTLSGRIAVDYDLSKQLQIGAMYNGSLSKPITEDDDLSLENNPAYTNQYHTVGRTERKRQLHTVNFHTIYKIDSLGKQLNLDFDFFTYRDKSDRNFDVYLNNAAAFESRNQNNALQNINNYSVNLDMEHPTKAVKLNYGARVSFSKTNNDLYSDIQQVGFLQQDLFTYRENTQALFFSGEREIGKKKEWSAKLGLRVENTQLESENVFMGNKNNTHYLKFFPTAYLQYKPTENNTISLDYGKRISRPSFTNLNPFRIYSSPFSYWEGNPSLTPSYTHNIELNYIYKDILQSVLYWEKIDDMFGGIVLLNNDNVTQRVTQLNYAQGQTYGFRQTYVYKKKKWLESYITGYIGYQKSTSEIYPLTPKEIEGFFSMIAISGNFLINSTMSTGFNLLHRFPNKSIDMVENKTNTLLDFYFKAKLWNKLGLVLSVNNILKEYQFNSVSERSGNRTYTNGYYDSRYVRLTLNYSFGGQINVNQRTYRNQEERNRTN